jgi:Ni2+-binding GTPase involved in maturation of urease and hydrogenase
MTITKSAIPVTVFTGERRVARVVILFTPVALGFLGAGKTTIILSLLPKLPKDYKVVLLKNEFGDVEGRFYRWDDRLGLMVTQSTASLPPTRRWQP